MRETYIIHVHRRDGAGLIVAGTVESIRKGAKRSFGSLDELWAYLNVQREVRRRRLSFGAGMKDGESED